MTTLNLSKEIKRFDGAIAAVSKIQNGRANLCDTLSLRFSRSKELRRVSKSSEPDIKTNDEYRTSTKMPNWKAMSQKAAQSPKKDFFTVLKGKGINPIERG